MVSLEVFWKSREEKATIMVRHCPDKLSQRHGKLRTVNKTMPVSHHPRRSRSEDMALSKSAKNRLLPNRLHVPAIVFLVMASATMVLPAMGQRSHHYFQRADMPPGAIGRAQLMRGGPLPGHFQAVEVTAPEGAHLALAMDGVFEPPRPAPLRAGMLVGYVYRLKVTNIPLREGQEVFPSIEIINRLYPPKGSEARFPIPIELTREELEMALRGQYVVRVIYLEDPRNALPLYDPPEHQRYFDAAAGQDPLEIADSRGRPMAILRLGSRVPELDHVTGRFLFQSPPWFRIPEVVSDEPAPSPATGAADDATAARGGRPLRPRSTAHRPLSNVGVNR